MGGHPTPLLRLRGLSKSFGPVVAVSPLDLEVNAGDFCAILGPSGCGKSTLLRMIAGFIGPSSGHIEIDGADVTKLGPEKRPTNMVFQSYGLFPHLTVAENIAFGLSLQKRPRDEIDERVDATLGLVRLEGFGARAIDKLSGGQQQRVALARALVMRPKVLLLDEPLAALDLKLRHQMQEELHRIHRDIGGTFIFVTHDQGEAFALASRVVVMNAGLIEQVGSPENVYQKPASLFVADFVGETTILGGKRRNGRIFLNAGREFDDAGPDGPVHIIIRPEHIQVDPLGLPALITDRFFLGASLKISGKLASGEDIIMRIADTEAGEQFTPASTVRLGWDASAQRIISETPP
jgi:ABC-type Fe3+/spermidine/putrescine transport system ATPase subunit